MQDIPMTFFSSNPPSLDQLYVKSLFNEVDCFYSVNRIYGLKRVISIAEENLQPILANSVTDFLNKDFRVQILNNLRIIHDEFETTLNQICKAVSIILNQNSGERQASTGINFPIDKCGEIEELNLSNCGINILPPQIEIFKTLKILNLSGNNLKFLPHELKDLPLTEINLQGNTWLQPNLPDWINQIALVILPNGTTLVKKTTNPLQHFQKNPKFSFVSQKHSENSLKCFLG
jgi:hypothetical protein